MARSSRGMTKGSQGPYRTGGDQPLKMQKTWQGEDLCVIETHIPAYSCLRKKMKMCLECRESRVLHAPID